jgi:hypothetical protein
MLKPHPLDRPRDSLQLRDEQLGEGGQGTVTRVLSADGLVYKEYLRHVGTPITPTLTELVEFGQALSPADRQSLFGQSAWPLARVVHEGAVIGFLMHEAPAEFTGPIGGKQRLVELQYLLYKPNHTWDELHQPDGAGRIEIAAAAVRLIDFLHRHGLVLGDISFRNLLWSPSQPYRVFMLDCDGVRRHGGEPVLPQAQTPDWNDPNLPGTGPDLDTDRYKIALLVGRGLTRNAYVRPGQRLDLVEGIDPRIADQVSQLFNRAAGPHGSRPTAQEWSQALSGRKWIAVNAPPVRIERPPPTDNAPLVTASQKRSYRPINLTGPVDPAPVPTAPAAQAPDPEPDPPEASSGEMELGKQVVASEAFDERQDLVSCRLSRDQIARLINLLAKEGGRMAVTRLVQPLNEQPDRMAMVLRTVCQLLNRDDEPVLNLRDDDQTLELDLPLLKEQFLEASS